MKEIEPASNINFEPITDQAARAIASILETGDSSVLHSFLVNGEVQLPAMQEELDQYIDSHEADPEITGWALKLGNYALRRVETDQAGPVDNWTFKWPNTRRVPLYGVKFSGTEDQVDE